MNCDIENYKDLNWLFKHKDKNQATLYYTYFEVMQLLPLSEYNVEDFQDYETSVKDFKLYVNDLKELKKLATYRKKEIEKLSLKLISNGYEVSYIMSLKKEHEKELNKFLDTSLLKQVNSYLEGLEKRYQI